MKRLAILGASGHGKVVADAALLAGWESVTFFDDRWPATRSVGPWDIAGDTSRLCQAGASFDGAVVAIGANAVRLEKQDLLVAAGLALATIIHPRAAVSPFADVGAGSVVFAGAVINVSARLGVGCIVNTGATVDHDCVLGDGVHLSPGVHLGGNVTVGSTTWVGIGASVRHGTVIGARSMIGAGAAVVRTIADDVTVVGVPARILSSTRGS